MAQVWITIADMKLAKKYAFPVIVETTEDIPALDEDTILFLDGKKALGQVSKFIGESLNDTIVCPILFVNENSISLKP